MPGSRGYNEATRGASRRAVVWDPPVADRVADAFFQNLPCVPLWLRPEELMCVLVERDGAL